MLIKISPPQEIDEANTEIHNQMQEFLKAVAGLSQPYLAGALLAQVPAEFGVALTRVCNCSEVNTELDRVVPLAGTVRLHAQAAHDADGSFRTDAAAFQFYHHKHSITWDEPYKHLFKEVYNFFVSTGFLNRTAFQAKRPQFRYDKTWFVKRFVEANPDLNACPYCGGPLTLEERSKLDHYFPKAHFPTLAVNLWNLVPVCHDCNSTQSKGDRDPLCATKKVGAIQNLCLPYGGIELAPHMCVDFDIRCRKKKLIYEVTITAEPGAPKDLQAQVLAFAELANLKRTWKAHATSLCMLAIAQLKKTAKSGPLTLAEARAYATKQVEEVDHPASIGGTFLHAQFWKSLLRSDKRLQLFIDAATPGAPQP
ncbi:MAG TPA: HNH endonuclease [Symbiobacteriaceae bacterium]|nr:HNH endonuclease [Symbiobacteriaceae bacterium]